MRILPASTLENTKNNSFGINKVKFDDLLPQRVLDSKEIITKRLLEEGNGDNFIRIIPETFIRTQYFNQPVKGEFMPLHNYKIDFTGKTLILVSKQAKTFGERIKNFFGFGDFKMDLCDSGTDSIINLTKKLLKDLNSN